MEVTPTVFIVDDDHALRESLRRLMQSVGLAAESFASAEAFLENFDSTRPGCLVLDVRMPGMTGLELQERLAASGCRIPIIIISAHGDVEQAVRAMRNGAIDFLRKPYKAQALLDRIRHALELDATTRRERAQAAEVAARLALLSTREHEVLKLLLAGRSSKEIAFELGISRKTVDVHRAQIRAKLQADSLVEILRMVQMC